ncbi:MAG: cyclic nucleotide-binding domain-containing protein [Thiogranum sp.]
MEVHNDIFTGLQEIGIGHKFKEELCRMLESTQLFRGFSRPEIECVVDYTHAYRAPVGVSLFREGGKDKYLAFIIKGKVNVLKEFGFTTEKHIATACSGSCLGEISMVDDFPHSATARIIEEAEVIILTKRNLLRITEESAALGIRILWRLARQLGARLRRTSGVLAEHL